MRLFSLSVLMALSLSTIAVARDKPRQVSSATSARDVNGISLGMHIDEARQIAPLSHVAGETFAGRSNGIAFEVGLTPLGRIFRVQSEQSLGRFQIDRRFVESLSLRLLKKYGQPEDNGLPIGPMIWNLVENVQHADGSWRPFNVMWASATLSTGNDANMLSIKLLDFRVLWTDEKRLNEVPRNGAIDSIRL